MGGNGSWLGPQGGVGRRKRTSGTLHNLPLSYWAQDSTGIKGSRRSSSAQIDMAGVLGGVDLLTQALQGHARGQARDNKYVAFQLLSSTSVYQAMADFFPDKLRARTPHQGSCAIPHHGLGTRRQVAQPPEGCGGAFWRPGKA